MAEQEVNLPVQLLRLVARGGVRSTADLARSMGVSEGLVRMMVEDMARRGYLVSLGDGGACGSGCAGCSSKAACHLPSGSSRSSGILTLTPSGREKALAS